MAKLPADRRQEPGEGQEASASWEQAQGRVREMAGFNNLVDQLAEAGRQQLEADLSLGESRPSEEPHDLVARVVDILCEAPAGAIAGPPDPARRRERERRRQKLGAVVGDEGMGESPRSDSPAWSHPVSKARTELAFPRKDEWDKHAPPELRMPGIKLAAREDLRALMAAHLAYLRHQERKLAKPELSPTLSSAAADTPVDLVERSNTIDAYKRECKAAGIGVTDEAVAKAARRSWNTRDPVTKWKAGKERPGDDAQIRRVFRDKPHLHTDR